MVEVTLSRTPALDAPPYAKSLVKFTYELDADKAFVVVLPGPGKRIDYLTVRRISTEFATGRFVRRPLLRSVRCSSHTGVMAQLPPRHEQGPVGEAKVRYEHYQ